VRNQLINFFYTVLYYTYRDYIVRCEVTIKVRLDFISNWNVTQCAYLLSTTPHHRRKNFHIFIFFILIITHFSEHPILKDLLKCSVPSTESAAHIPDSHEATNTTSEHLLNWGYLFNDVIHSRLVTANDRQIHEWSNGRNLK
jgi:hypothetical protein